MVGVDDPFLLKGAIWAWVLGEQMLLVFRECIQWRIIYLGVCLTFFGGVVGLVDSGHG